MLSAARRDAALRALDDLESERLGAWSTVLNTWVADDAGRDVAVNFLGNQVPQLIQRLGAQLDRIDTEAQWYSWVDAATELHNSINDTVGYVQEWSMANVLRATGEQTAVEVKNIAQKGLFAGVSAFTFLVLGVIAWKVLR